MKLRFNKCRFHPKYRGKEPVYKDIAECTCDQIYRSQNPFGSPAEIPAGQDKRRIYLWRVGASWRFIEAFEDDFDAIVSEEWLDEVYSTSEIHRNVMLETLARQIGLIEDEQYKDGF